MICMKASQRPAVKRIPSGFQNAPLLVPASSDALGKLGLVKANLEMTTAKLGAFLMLFIPVSDTSIHSSSQEPGSDLCASLLPRILQSC